MTSEPTDDELRDIWRDGLRSTGPVPALSNHDAYNSGITAALRAVWDAARAADAEEIARLRSIQQAIYECKEDPRSSIIAADRAAGKFIIEAHAKVLAAEAERDALAQQIAAVRALDPYRIGGNGTLVLDWSAVAIALAHPSPVTPESETN